MIGTVFGIVLGTIVGITLSERSHNWKNKADGYRDMFVAFAIIVVILVVTYRAAYLWNLTEQGGD